MCCLPEDDRVTRLELCHSSRGRESTKVMENKALISLTSCVTSEVRLIYPRLRKSRLFSSNAVNENY